jgi:hypothetical protein
MNAARIKQRRLVMVRSSRVRRRDSDLAIATSALRLALALGRLRVARRMIAAAASHA